MPALKKEMLEHKVDEKIVKWFKESYPEPDGIVIKLSMAGAHGTAGWPDRMFLWRGKAAFIEMKATGKVATELQDERIKQLRRARFAAECFDDPEPAVCWLSDVFG